MSKNRLQPLKRIDSGALLQMVCQIVEAYLALSEPQLLVQARTVLIEAVGGLNTL